MTNSYLLTIKIAKYFFTRFIFIMNTVNNNISFGRCKIPRYIYHFTNKRNYNSMQKDGFIKVCDRDPYLNDKGIFAIDLQNYFKRWGCNKVWRNEPLYIALLREVVSWRKPLLDGAQNFIVLRIPTAKLDLSKLKIRSQKEFFKHKYSGARLQSRCFSIREHLAGRTSAREAKLYTSKNDAIEYIYQDNIPVNAVEQIGNIVDIPRLRTTPDISYDRLGKAILKEALKGTNEAKGLHLLKD